ncbi:MAG: lactate utilization protein C [Bacteroidota bacterium]|jgi:L-lactate dehydrogenase complex protein LldG
MNVSPSKENILKRIRLALATETPVPFPHREPAAVVPALNQDIEVEFAERFAALEGKFIYCINRQELAFQLGSLIRKMNWEKVFCVEEVLKPAIEAVIGDRLFNEDLSKADVSITGCECLVARTGSIVLSAAQTDGRTASVYAPIHVCVAFTSQLVYDIGDAFQQIKNRHGDRFPSLVSFATGPSRTADIEKTLVVGVHGPKEVYLLLVEG